MAGRALRAGARVVPVVWVVPVVRYRGTVARVVKAVPVVRPPTRPLPDTAVPVASAVTRVLPATAVLAVVVVSAERV